MRREPFSIDFASTAAALARNQYRLLPPFVVERVEDDGATASTATVTDPPPPWASALMIG
jgi:hypothetical protein